MPELYIALFCLGKLKETTNILVQDIEVDKLKGCKIRTFVIQTVLPPSL